MLEHLKWPLHKHKRNFLELIMFYKILHGLADTSITFIAPSQHLRTCGYNQCFVIPFTRTDTHIQIPSYPPPLNCEILYQIHWLDWMTLINLELIYPLTSSPQTNFCIIICVLSYTLL